jgi:hypothetical protein
MIFSLEQRRMGATERQATIAAAMPGFRTYTPSLAAST